MGGSGGGSNQAPVVTSQQANKDPWGPAQPYLMQSLNNAQGLWMGDLGMHPWTGPTQAAIDPRLQQGLDTTQSMAQGELGGTTGVNATRSFLQGQVENEGLSGGMKDYVLPNMQQMYSEADGQQNPYLQAILDTSNRQIADKVNSSMSGAGRYGSGQHADVMTRALAESANPILAQDYTQRQAMKQGLLRDIDTIYSGGLGRAMQAGQMIPGMDNARYAGADRLMGLGQFYQQRAQNDLNAQIDRWNAEQARPWENAARYAAIVGGAGGLGGTMSSTTATPSVAPPLSNRILGGAAVGGGLGSAFGPVGAGIGALGGAGLGYFLG